MPINSNGLSPEVLEAVKRRQAGQPPNPALNQISNGAPNAPQMPNPTPQYELTQASGPAGAATPEPPKMPKFEPQDRQDLITVALIEQLKNDNKLVKEQQESPVSAPQAAPVASQQPAPQPAMTPGIGAPAGGGSFSMSPGFEQPMSVNQMQSNYANGMGKDYSGLNGYGR